MSIDNQLLIGTLVFAGLGYYILTQAQPSKEETVITEKDKTAAEIVNEFDRLQVRMREFEENDEKKGKNRVIAPLTQSDREGLVEVLTLLRQVEKKQQKTRALDKGTAERFHRDVSKLDTKARDYLDRYKQNQDSHLKDRRSVTKHPAHMASDAAFKRGRVSHSRSAAPFVADSRSKSAGKKRKPNFVQIAKPATILEAPQASDNRVRSAGSRSAFETNDARDDTLVHATENADMEEAAVSGAHGKNGQHIRPLDASGSEPSRGGSVVFDQARGPEADNVDTRSVSTDVAEPGEKRSGEEVLRSKSRSKPRTVDLTEDLTVNALEEMRRDLFEQMGQLKAGATRLDKALDERLRTIVSTVYKDDAEGGDQLIQLLRAYALRDKDKSSRKGKRPLASVSIAKGKEKLQIRQVSEGSRVIIARGGGALAQRSGRFGPSTASTAGRSSASRERAYDDLTRSGSSLERQGSRSRSVSPRNR
jgi:hypothetical protein